jgi:CheY-like chemotaxis protein
MELEGHAVFLDSAVGGLVMGLAFEKPKPEIASAIRSLVSSRTTAIPSSLPAKARRKPEAPPQPQEPTPTARPAAVVEAPQAPSPAPGVPAPEPAPVAEAPVAGGAPEAQAATPPRNDVRLLLKKRTRGVVALVHSPAFAILMKDFLQEEGYGRVQVTADPKELFEFLQQPNLSALLIDGDFGVMESLQFVTQLVADFPSLPPVVLALEAASAALVLAAHRAGASQLLVKPYALDNALSDQLNQLMGI